MRIVNPVGKKGEDEAEKFLTRKGYKILERNYRKQYGEIDIIAIDTNKKEPVLVFIEVKTRTSSQFGLPLEAITPWKLKPLLKTAQLYVVSHSKLPELQRFDAISIILLSSGAKIEHMENIS